MGAGKYEGREVKKEREGEGGDSIRREELNGSVTLREGKGEHRLGNQDHVIQRGGSDGTEIIGVAGGGAV